MCRRCHKRTSVRRSGGREHIVRHHRTANALECKLADRFDRYGLINRLPNARADEDLTWLSFIAKPRCDVRDSANGGIIPATFKSNGAERCKAMCDANPEAKVMAKVPPLLNQSADCCAHFERHQDGL